MINTSSPASSSGQSSFRGKKHVSFQDQSQRGRQTPGLQTEMNVREREGTFEKKQPSIAGKTKSSTDANKLSAAKMNRDVVLASTNYSARERPSNLLNPRNERIALVHPYIKGQIDNDEDYGHKNAKDLDMKHSDGVNYHMELNNRGISKQEKHEKTKRTTTSVTIHRGGDEEKARVSSTLSINVQRSPGSLPGKPKPQESVEAHNKTAGETQTANQKYKQYVDIPQNVGHSHQLNSKATDRLQKEQVLSTVERIARLRHPEENTKSHSVPTNSKSIRVQGEQYRRTAKSLEPADSNLQKRSQSFGKSVENTGGDNRRRYSAESYKSYKKRKDSDKKRAEVREVINHLNKEEQHKSNETGDSGLPPKSSRHVGKAAENQTLQDNRYETVADIRSKVNVYKIRSSTSPHERQDQRSTENTEFDKRKVKGHVQETQSQRGKGDVRKGPVTEVHSKHSSGGQPARNDAPSKDNRRSRPDERTHRGGKAVDRKRDSGVYSPESSDVFFNQAETQKTRKSDQGQKRQSPNREKNSQEVKSQRSFDKKELAVRELLAFGNLDMAQALGLPEDIIELVREEERFWKRQSELRKWRESQEKRLDELENERKRLSRDEAKERRIEELRREHQEKKSEGKLRQIGGYNQVFDARDSNMNYQYASQKDPIYGYFSDKGYRSDVSGALSKGSRSLTLEELRAVEEELLAQQAERLVRMQRPAKKSTSPDSKHRRDDASWSPELKRKPQRNSAEDYKADYEVSMDVCNGYVQSGKHSRRHKDDDIEDRSSYVSSRTNTSGEQRNKENFHGSDKQSRASPKPNVAGVKFDSDRERQYELLLQRLSQNSDDIGEHIGPSYISEEPAEIEVSADQECLSIDDHDGIQRSPKDVAGYISPGNEAVRERTRDSLIRDLKEEVDRNNYGFFSDDEVFTIDDSSERGRDYFSDPEILRGDTLRVSNPWKLREAKPISIHQLYALRCAACGRSIDDDNIMNVDGKQLFWHNGCFICVVCKTKLTSKNNRKIRVRIIQLRLHCGQCYTSNGDQLSEV